MFEKIREFFKRDKFADYIGAELVEAEEGYAVARIEIAGHHLNGLGMVQGGVIFTLADFAFAVATNSSGIATVGVNANISYFKTPKGRFITAKAKEISSGKKISGCDVEVFDEDGTLIAKYSGTGYRKNATIDYNTGKVS